MSKSKINPRILEIEKKQQKAQSRKKINHLVMQIFAVMVIFGMILSSVSTLLTSFVAR